MRVYSSSSNTRARHNFRPGFEEPLPNFSFTSIFSSKLVASSRLQTYPGIPFFPLSLMYHCHYRIFTAVVCDGPAKEEAFATVNYGDGQTQRQPRIDERARRNGRGVRVRRQARDNGKRGDRFACPTSLRQSTKLIRVRVIKERLEPQGAYTPARDTQSASHNSNSDHGAGSTERRY